MPPLFSVIIPSYNSARYVVDAVESVLDQTYSPIEIIVIDDGSIDDTKLRLAPYRDRIQYVFQPNGGLSRARNRGMELAKGDWLAFLDADDIWLPEKLARQWKCLDGFPQVDLVHTDSYVLHDDTGATSHLYKERFKYTGNCYIQLLWQNMVTVSSVMVSRRCIEKVGPFDENIRGATTQDYDLWIRIAREHMCAYVDAPLVGYRVHSSNYSRNKREMLEDEYYVLKKALQDNPGLPAEVGAEWFQTRLFELAFDAGESCVEAKDLRKARYYFNEARCISPFKRQAWLHFASTFGPLRVRRMMRSAKSWFKNRSLATLWA